MQKRVNVKILSLDEVINKPYSNVTIELNDNCNLDEIKNYCLLKVKQQLI